LCDDFSQFWLFQLAAQPVAEKVGAAIWLGRCCPSVFWGASVLGLLIVGMYATIKEGRLAVGPAQRMDQQPFAGVKGKELVDGQRR
jgi:hypothetical protein